MKADNDFYWFNFIDKKHFMLFLKGALIINRIISIQIKDAILVGKQSLSFSENNLLQLLNVPEYMEVK
jgi:hypothetical protein